ncbi:DNA repair protein, Rev1 [Niveomyces insectorum RCEF 264]|uniref:DNA repair protein REV1 n=1 Tax=Niveomyces insectorum RCEF 264 TaxID=1081102 RepID=A0A162JGK0_9HYPO|nr:DNA repair protein, Rev1 [Niveomyces insectorum RCEF 264]
MSNQLEKNSAAVRKKLEARKFIGEDGEEYGASKFGEFGDYFRRKKLKLHNEDIIMRNSVQGKPQIFKDVVAHVASYTQPPPEELRRLLILHGAQFIKYLDFKTMVTHIIVSTLPPKKADEWRRLRVVKPAWVVDSVAAGKILPWSDYRLINDDPQQKQIQFGDGKMAVGEAIPNQMAGYREQSKNSFYTEQVRELAAAQDNKRQAPSLFRQLETLAADEGIFDPADDPNGHDITTDDNSIFSPRENEQSDPDTDNEGSGKTGAHSRDNDETGNDKSDVRSVDEIVDVPGMESVAEDNIEDVKDTYIKQDVDDSTLIQRLCESKEEHKEFTTTLSPGKAPQSPLGKKAIMTPEEHNALLLADPKIRKASTANPDFLKQFYSESRLHHLSTWKAELKSKMQRRAAEKASQVVQKKGQVKRKLGARRYIMHVDFDSFFCAVSLKSAPDYVDKPAVVAHSTGSGSEIASCNYPARKFGVKNGMWMKRAMELCPDLKVLPYDFPAYEEASELFYEAILDVGGVVQSVSVDEALVDITSIVLSETASWGVGVSEGSIWREQEKANEIGTKLRQQIKDKTGCNVSVGIGGNILLAKVALRRAKPAGQYQIRPEEVLSLLGELEVEKLPGVAYSIGGKLEEIGVRLVQDLRNVSKERLVAVLGPKTGERLWEYARGIDRTEVGDQPVRKSVSAEVNWGIRFISQEEAEEFVMNLCKELERRLLNEQVRGRSLTMKILRRSADAPLDPEKHLGHGKCDIFNKSVAFGVAVHDAETIGKEAVSILRSFRFSPGDLRGMGVQLQKLEPIKTAFSVSDGSQKKLTFGKATLAAERKEPEGGKPGKIISSEDQAFFFSPSSSSLAAAAASGDQEKRTKSPHIIPSTQFFMPMNPDPSVLAELPSDIIRRLVAQSSGDTGANNNNSGRNNIPSPVKRESRASSPAAASIHSASAADDLPSDIDPDVFEALPPDMQVEILAEYRQHGRQQSGSPAPSPRRRMAASTMRSGTSTSTRGGLGKKVAGRSPVKRGIWGTRGLAAAAAARERKHDAEANRVQTSLFVPAAAPAVSDIAADDDNNGNNGNATDFLLEELDPEVLAALPEDVRAEVLENHTRQQQAQQAQSMLHLEIPENRAGRLGADATTTAAGQERGQTLLNFPPPPPKMSFRTATAIGDDASSAVLLSFDKIKDMLKTWHNTTRHDGPHETDVAVLERYLAGVVTQERDMEKARKLVVWLEWLVEEDDAMGAEGNNAPGKHGWTLAVARIKAALQEAMRSRGLGPLQFV